VTAVELAPPQWRQPPPSPPKAPRLQIRDPSSSPSPSPSSSSTRILSPVMFRTPTFHHRRRGRHPCLPVLRPIGQVEGVSHRPQQLLDVRFIALSAQPRCGLSVRAGLDLYGGGERGARVQCQLRRCLSSSVGVHGHGRGV
jgi:hypothetical protein